MGFKRVRPGSFWKCTVTGEGVMGTNLNVERSTRKNLFTVKVFYFCSD